MIGCLKRNAGSQYSIHPDGVFLATKSDIALAKQSFLTDWCISKTIKTGKEHQRQALASILLDQNGNANKALQTIEMNPCSGSVKMTAPSATILA